MIKITGLDLDNVLADFVQTFLEFVYLKTGERYTYSDITQYHFEKALGFPGERMMRLYQMFNEENWWRRVKPFPFASDFVRRLHSKGFSVVVVTSRPRNCESETYRWFRKNAIPIDDLLIADGVPKSRLVRKSGYDFRFFVEDGAHFACDLARVVPRVYLIEYPWNATWKNLNHNIRRVCSLDEIFQYES